MPTNIIVGLVALLVALVLYTIGTWAAFRAKTVKAWHLVVLWVALGFDVLATIGMGMQIGGLDLRPGMPLWHTIFALVAFFLFLAVTAVGTWAYIAGKEDVKASVARAIVAPWVLWVAVFVWGMVTRGAARMGG